MGLIALDPNQRSPERDACWILRPSMTIDEAPVGLALNARHAFVRLPYQCRLLGGFEDVLTAATGTTLTGNIALENQGGDVDLTASSDDLKATGRMAIDVADENVLTLHDASKNPVDIVLDIDASTAPVAPLVLACGFYVSRTEYNRV